jgi:hypothetical protein
VECYGGGTFNYFGLGGLETANGAAYSKSNLSITPTTNVWINPGFFDGGQPRDGNSWVSLTSNIQPYANSTTTAVKACGGQMPVELHISQGIGEIKYRGGKTGNTFFTVIDYGGETGFVSTYYRGGFGGAAGPAGNGGNGYPTTSTTVFGGGGGANGGADATGSSGGNGRFGNTIGAGGSAGNLPYTEYITETTVPIVYFPEYLFVSNLKYPAQDYNSRQIYVSGGKGGFIGSSAKIAGSAGYLSNTSYMASGTPDTQGYGLVLITYTYPKFTAVFGIENGGLVNQGYYYRNSNYPGKRANTWAIIDTWIKLPSDIPNVITAECFTGITEDGGGSYSKSNINVSPNQSIYIGGINKYNGINTGAFVNTLANTLPTLANGTTTGCYAANGNVFTQETRSVGLVKYRGGQNGTAVSIYYPPSGESSSSTTFYFGGRGGQAGPNGRGGHGSPGYISPGGTYFYGAGGGANGGGDASNNIPGVNRFGTYGAGAGGNIFVWPNYPNETNALANAEVLVYTDSAFGNTTVLLLGGSSGYTVDSYPDYNNYGYETYNKVVLSYTSTVSGNVQTKTYAYAYIIG